MDKIYTGIRIGKERDTGSEVVVTVNGETLKHHIVHSPTGFAWGYNGSGPADLAIAILWDFLGEEPDHKTAMEFKNDIVSGWGNEWTIEEYEIENWYEVNIISGHVKDQRLPKQLREEEEKRKRREPR